MGEEGIATAHDAPDGVFLMRVEGDMRGEKWATLLLTPQTALPMDSGGSYRDPAGQGKGRSASPASTMGSTS